MSTDWKKLSITVWLCGAVWVLAAVSLAEPSSHTKSADIAETTTATGDEISMWTVPVGNHPDGTWDPGVLVHGSEVVVPPGQRLVFFDVRLGDWDPTDAGVGLSGYGWWLSTSRFSDSSDGRLRRTTASCVTDDDCVAAFGGGTCRLFPDSLCDPGDCCAGVFVDNERPDYVMADVPPSVGGVPFCDPHDPERSRCIATLPSGGYVDDPVPFPADGVYLGTLVVEITSTMLGSYTSPLRPDGTWIANQDGAAIYPLELGRATVTVSLDCNTNGTPDVIEILDGAGPDCNHNGQFDGCERGSTDPLLTSPKNRYLTVNTHGLEGDVAIKVTFDDLAPPYDVFNGSVMWVTQPSQISMSPGHTAPQAGFGSFMAASLTCSPFLTEWLPYPNIIHISHTYIVPGSTYTYQGYDETLAPLGDPITVTTVIWGDTVGPFDTDGGHWHLPDGSIDVASDVISALDTFANNPCGPHKTRADLSPATPDRKINIDDVVAILDAFTGLPIPFAPGDPPCP